MHFNMFLQYLKPDMLYHQITLSLILGTNIIPMQLYAVKNNSDSHDEIETWGGDFSKNTKSKANQHLDQDNFCYRSPECQQANDAQQIQGKGNDATGFNDQSALESVDNQGQPGPAGNQGQPGPIGPVS
jgi:hypothetical protein